MGSPVRCVVVDHNLSFLHAIREVLEYEGIVIAGLASTSADAARVVGRHRSDLVLVDLALGPESGFDLAEQLVAGPAERPTVVLMSTYPEDDLRPMVETRPAAAFIPKTEISGAALREVHHRRRRRCPRADDHRSAVPPAYGDAVCGG